MGIVGWLKEKSTRVRVSLFILIRRLPSRRAVLTPALATLGKATTRTRRALLDPVVLAAILLVAALVVVPLEAPPLTWLPAAEDSLLLLGPILGAQAAIAALTLAVTLFVMQGVRSREDTDGRVYSEYVRQSRVHLVFRGSLIALGVTGTVLLAEKFISESPKAVAATPGLPNLALLATLAFLGNLALAAVLFEKAMRLARPDQWQALRLEVNRRDVRDAVQSFLKRDRRAAASQEATEPNWADWFPDPGEGSANEAVQSLLDDARRAMAERRLGQFKSSIESVKELVSYAMEEIEGEGLKWSPPGSQPQWPPLRELGGNLYSFREEVIRRGDRDYVHVLLGLDYSLLSSGVRRRCGELFSAALQGYRWNYEIVCRAGNDELHEFVRDRVWEVADGIVLTNDIEDLGPYLAEMVNHQERLLSVAMHGERPDDYESLHNAFQRVRRAVEVHRDVRGTARVEAADAYQQLSQGYRIALMGLGGRAALLAESGRMLDPQPYLDVARRMSVDLRQWADDIAQALARGVHTRLSLWSEWEMEGAESFEFRSVDTERYPLSFFAIRLLELVAENTPRLGLGGRAKQVLGWLEGNLSRLEAYVQDDPERRTEQQRDFALRALRNAVHQEEVAEDEECILWSLSKNRVEAFTAGVLAGAFTRNAIERVFERAGAFRYVTSDAETAPERRSFRRLVPKGFLADVPDDADAHYVALEGDQWGWSHAEDAIQLLCEALDEAPTSTVPVDTLEELLQAIDDAREDMEPSGDLVVLLAGDWHDILFTLEVGEPNGYEPGWQLPEAERDGQQARYRGFPIFEGPAFGECRLYVLEPAAWGCFVRAQVEGDQDLLVEVETITEGRARELLSESPDHFPDERDEAAKVRKLRTFVEVGVAARIGFRVADRSRARRITRTQSAQ